MRMSNVTSSVVQELQKENDLLVQQLHVAQEMLERFYLNRNYKTAIEKCDTKDHAQSCPKSKGTEIVFDKKLAELEVLELIHKAEKENSMNVLVGNLVLNSLGSMRGIFLMPFLVLKLMCCKWKSKKIDKSGFELRAVLEIYKNDGYECALDRLKQKCNGVCLSDMCTDLARKLKAENKLDAARFALVAYFNDPKPFRLKWLAFRLNEFGLNAYASAIFTLQRDRMSFNPNEIKKTKEIELLANKELLKNSLGREKFETVTNSIINFQKSDLKT